MVQTAVILVAGYEKKLSPLSDSMHQCLLRFGAKTRLETMLETLALLGVKHVVLVIGHYGDKVIALLGASYAGLSLTYVWNRDYRKTNVMYSLWLARSEVGGAFMLLDGDMSCESGALSMMLDCNAENAVMVDSIAPEKSGAFMASTSDGMVKALGRQIQADSGESLLRTLGVTLVGSSLAPRLFDLVDKLITLGQKNLVYEDALNALLDDFPLRAVDIAGHAWTELDSLENLMSLSRCMEGVGDLAEFARHLGAETAVYIDPKDIVFDPRTSLLCLNCGRYGKKKTCPPFIPNLEYQAIVRAYSQALLVAVRMTVAPDRNFAQIREASTNALHRMLLLLEKAAFNQNAYYAASLIGGSCKLCPDECGEQCRKPNEARMPMEAVGIDVIKTAEHAGLFLRFPAEESISRVGLLLIA